LAQRHQERMHHAENRLEQKDLDEHASRAHTLKIEEDR
jgi:flagellar biosynthesis chaperone FliJ